MSIYAKEFVGLLADSRFLDAYKLVPYFAFGTFLWGLPITQRFNIIFQIKRI